MKSVQMDESALLYIVLVEGGTDDPFDAVYGYDPIVFTDEDKADAKADELSSSGEWAEQPRYYVQETTLGDLLETFPHALSRGIA